MSQRICPGCGEVKDALDLAHGGGQWYTRERKHREIAGEVVIDDATEVIPSPYCRDCTGKRNTESRRKTTLIDRLVKVSRSARPREIPAAEWPGTCEICGDQTQNVVVVESPRLGFCCWRCDKLIQSEERRSWRCCGPAHPHRPRARTDGEGHRGWAVAGIHLNGRSTRATSSGRSRITKSAWVWRCASGTCCCGYSAVKQAALGV